MIQLEAPFTEEKIRALHLGDEVEITGIIFTMKEVNLRKAWICMIKSYIIAVPL